MAILREAGSTWIFLKFTSPCGPDIDCQHNDSAPTTIFGSSSGTSERLWASKSSSDTPGTAVITIPGGRMLFAQGSRRCDGVAVDHRSDRYAPSPSARATATRVSRSSRISVSEASVSTRDGVARSRRPGTTLPASPSRVADDPARCRHSERRRSTARRRLCAEEVTSGRLGTYFAIRRPCVHCLRAETP